MRLRLALSVIVALVGGVVSMPTAFAVVQGARSADVVSLYRSIEPDVLSEQVRIRIQRTIAQHAQRAGELRDVQDFFACNGHRVHPYQM